MPAPSTIPPAATHRHRHVDRPEQLGERHEPVLERAEERPPVAAGLGALGDDPVHAGAREDGRLLGGRGRPEHRDPALLQRLRVDEPEREA